MGDLLEPMGPIVAAAGEDLHSLVGEMHLDTIAVELDFVNPAVPGRARSIEDASAGSTKPGRDGLDAECLGF